MPVQPSLPSSQQRVRLLLTLGERLASLERQAEAFEYYEQFLKEFPDYPAKADVYAKLLPLARNLNKTAEIKKYQALTVPEASAAAPTNK